MSSLSRRGTASEDSEAISIRVANGRRDAFYLARQWSHYFGAEYGPDRLHNPPATIAGWDDSDGQFGAVATHGDVHVGGLLASIVDGDDAEEVIGPTPIDEQALVGTGAMYVYFIEADSAWRQRGISTRLLSEAMEWGRDRPDVDTAVAHSWQRRNHTSSAPLFEKEGFIRVVDLPDYYVTAGRESCPDCGIWRSDDGECRCGAVLFAKDI